MTGEVVRVDVRALCRRLSISRMSVSRMVKDGRLPPPSYLGEKRVWRLDLIEAWEAAHITSEPPPKVVDRTARARSHKARVAGRAGAAVPHSKGAPCGP